MREKNANFMYKKGFSVCLIAVRENYFRFLFFGFSIKLNGKPLVGENFGYLDWISWFVGSQGMASYEWI